MYEDFKNQRNNTKMEFLGTISRSSPQPPCMKPQPIGSKQVNGEHDIYETDPIIMQANRENGGLRLAYKIYRSYSQMVTFV